VPGSVAEEPDDGQRRKPDGDGSSDRARPQSQQRGALAPTGDDAGEPAQDGGECDPGELPVPVDGGADEIRGVGGGRERYEAVVAEADGRDERNRQRKHEEREPDDAELGERLQIEVVGIVDVLCELAVLDVVALVRAGAIPDEQVGVRLVPGDLPERDAAVVGEV